MPTLNGAYGDCSFSSIVKYKMESFRKLGMSEALIKALKEHGFTEPSEIQEKTIPLVLAGKDVLGGAQTGSGKTLAFGAGLLQNCQKGLGIQALILTPTRELAEQISRKMRNFSKRHIQPRLGLRQRISFERGYTIPFCAVSSSQEKLRGLRHGLWDMVLMKKE